MALNKAQIIGNLGVDPDVKVLQSGTTIAKFSVATTEKWKNKEGAPQERTEWHRITSFGKLAEIAGKYLKKGRQVYIEGSLRTDKYTDKEGVERYATGIIATSIEFLGSANREGDDDDDDAASQSIPPTGGHPDIGEDDIPF